MQIKNSSYLALCALVLLFLLPGCVSNTSSIPVTVNLGNPPKGGGPCTGKGLCSAVSEPAPAASSSGVAATMQVSPSDKNVLVMTFSLAELQKKQPEQAAYFNERATSYDFDGAYDLSDKMFEKLKLAPGAKIDQNSKSKMEIKGDVVTISYTYTHN